MVAVQKRYTVAVVFIFILISELILFYSCNAELTGDGVFHVEAEGGAIYQCCVSVIDTDAKSFDRVVNWHNEETEIKQQNDKKM